MFINKYPLKDCAVYVKVYWAGFKGQRAKWFFLNFILSCFYDEYEFRNPFESWNCTVLSVLGEYAKILKQLVMALEGQYFNQAGWNTKSWYLYKQARFFFSHIKI